MKMKSLFPVLLLVLACSCTGHQNPNVSDVRPDESDAIDQTIRETVPDLVSETGQDSRDTDVSDPWKNIKIKEFPELDPSVCSSDQPPERYGFDNSYKMIRSGSFVQDKNFYLFDILEFDPVFSNLVKNDGFLQKIGANIDKRLQKAVDECKNDVSCIRGYLTLSKDTIEAVANHMKTALISDKTNIAVKHLRPSGVFALFADEDDAEMVYKTVVDQMNGLNHTIGDFIDNIPPENVTKIVSTEAKKDTKLFFSPLLDIAMALMSADKRDEAARYEPMEDGENKAAVEHLADIDWDVYPFTVILTPGEGPTNMNTPLSSVGAQRCDESYLRWKAGVAPIIVVSGGHVHPDRTPYAEAIEMKKYLMSKYNVPEYAIIVEPHARHTTTNMRDTTRLLIRYGIPVDRPFIVTTDIFQSMYILTLDDRCMKELRYLPYRSLKRMTKTDNCLLPSFHSLYYSSDDPLDP